MPISRGEFEQGEIDLRLVIIEFLRVNIDSAYTLNEIIEELVSEGIACLEQDVVPVLNALVDNKRIELKSIGGVLYYMYFKALGFRPS